MGLFDWLFGMGKVKDLKSTPPSKSIPRRPIDKLKERVKAIGHPKHPFLHREYSPGSRVPCTDFTAFIIERLKMGDLYSIYTLMRSIIEANPGVGIGSSWINEEIRIIIKTDLNKYISFDDPSAILELKAMWIISAKAGGARDFWLTERTPLQVAQALCIYNILLKPGMTELLDKVNSFIRKMRKDNPYWDDQPLFSANDLTLPELSPSECVRKIRSLSIGARLHLFCAICFVSNDLPDVTDYATRSFGLHIPDTTKEILTSQLLTPAHDPQFLKETMNKDDLIAACKSTGTAYKKSWNKTKILQSLVENASGCIEKLMERHQFVLPNPNYTEELHVLRSRAEQLETIFKIICFA
jgi:hypothetical protein